MKNNFSVEGSGKIARSVIFEKLTEKEGLLGEAARRARRWEIGYAAHRERQKHSSAPRPQSAAPRVNLRLESAHDLPQMLFGFLEHAEIIKRVARSTEDVGNTGRCIPPPPALRAQPGTFRDESNC